MLSQLARSYPSGDLTHIDELAERESLPANYLVQILNEMRNGGLVVSRRGKQGGYALGRAPEEISLREIVRVVDGEMLVTHLSRDGESGPAVARIWEEIGAAFVQEVERFNLTDFISAEGRQMYYI